MFRKLYFILGIICAQILRSGVLADSSSSDHSQPTKFYEGVIGGIERMTGRRSEGLIETVGGARFTTSYSSSYRMLENNAYLSFVTGFLWKLPPLPLLIGPEFYFGRGNTRSTVTDTVQKDPNNGNYRLYSADYARKFFYGALLRVGYQFCRDYLVAFSLGIDRSQFNMRRYFAIAPTVPPTVINRTRGINGIVFGLGLERHFKNFLFGIDFKLIQFRRQQTQDNVPVANAVASSIMFVRPIMYVAGLRLAYVF